MTQSEHSNNQLRTTEKPSDPILSSRGQLEERRTQCLDSKKYSELNSQQQLNYCRIHKDLSDNYWLGFEKAVENGNFELAARDFQSALEMGNPQARVLFDKKAAI